MGRIPLFVALAGLVCLAACASDTYSGDETENQAPNVWLSSGPPEGSTGSYSVQLFWGGWDPDGEIDYYEFLITDNTTGVFDPDDTTGVAWNPVYSNDSTFVFSADSLAEEPGETDQTLLFSRSHTFFIRAVDEVGLRSREPAYRSFTSTTISPEVRITTPAAILGITPADMPPISTLVWEATDYVNDENTKQEPDSVQWAMESTAAHGGSYIQTMDFLKDPVLSKDVWYPWSWYRAPQDSGKSWTTPPLNFGDYVFAVRAKDEAGAITPVLDEPVNMKRIKIQRRLSGPTFIVTSSMIGSIIAATCDYPLTIVDVPSDVDISFLLSACAEHYGGTVIGYRYGWDILDLDDPAQWEIDYTPFIGSTASTPPRAFNFGTHTFTAEVKDNSGFCSRVEVKINIIRFNGDRDLLIVDDYKPDEAVGMGWVQTNGGIPSDAEHDGFWNDMVSDASGYDRTRDMIATTVERNIPLATIAVYKSIIWNVFGDVGTTFATNLPLLYDYIQYRSKRPPLNVLGACSPTGGVKGKVVPNVIALAMQAGVHVLIAGNHPIQNTHTRGVSPPVRWPAIPLYEFEPRSQQTGSAPLDLGNPPGDLSFTYRDLCVDVIDFGFLPSQRARVKGSGNVSQQRYCPINDPPYRAFNSSSRRDDTMRTGIPIDLNFPSISLRPECANVGKLFAPSTQGIDVEVYNPAYFRQGAACQFVQPPRPCFQPIYGNGCLDTAELTYGQPVAFWTDAYGDVISEDIVGAVAARSAVFGFPPVYFTPSQVKPAIEYIIFDEWQLPRFTAAAAERRLDEQTSAR